MALYDEILQKIGNVLFKFSFIKISVGCLLNIAVSSLNDICVPAINHVNIFIAVIISCSLFIAFYETVFRNFFLPRQSPIFTEELRNATAPWNNRDSGRARTPASWLEVGALSSLFLGGLAVSDGQLIFSVYGNMRNRRKQLISCL